MMRAGLAPGILATTLVMGIGPSGVSPVNGSSSTWQPASLSWPMIQRRDSAIALEPGVRGPKSTICLMSSNARWPLKVGIAGAVAFSPRARLNRPGSRNKTTAAAIRQRAPASLSLANRRSRFMILPSPFLKIDKPGKADAQNVKPDQRDPDDEDGGEVVGWDDGRRHDRRDQDGVANVLPQESRGDDAE